MNLFWFKLVVAAMTISLLTSCGKDDEKKESFDKRETEQEEKTEEKKPPPPIFTIDKNTKLYASMILEVQDPPPVYDCTQEIKLKILKLDWGFELRFNSDTSCKYEIQQSNTIPFEWVSLGILPGVESETIVQFPATPRTERYYRVIGSNLSSG